jgi:hypothetical protein
MKTISKAVEHRRGVDQFLAQHGADVTGVISGYDRLRLRGSLRHLYQPTFTFRYLCAAGVLLKDFAAFVSGLTNRVCAASQAFAAAQGRPLRYLESCVERKETLARQLAERDHIEEGLIGVFSVLEPCLTYTVRKDTDAHRLVLHLGQGRCLHHYFYFAHPEFGLMHLRLQTWFPFQVVVCLNGRLWLARQLDRAGIGYLQRDNCFTAIDDLVRAQRFADRQLRTDWPAQLQPLLKQCHPLAAEICRPLALSYYWSIDQSEFATDVMFKSPAALATIYPALVHHGIQHFGTPEVLRFLGRSVPAHGQVHRLYQGEVETELKHRPEGMRLKHFAQGNGLKLYDKHSQVLRVETTMTNPEAFRVYRTPESQPHGRKRWMMLRKSVADATRRAQVSAAINDRYLGALASARVETAAGVVAAPLCRRVIKKRRRYRALNPWSAADAALLEAVARGEWTIQGFRNRDLRAALFPAAHDPRKRRRQVGRVTRLLSLLRAHRLIRKVTGTHRYIVTASGRKAITALLAARHASIEQLLKIAA